MGRGRVRPQHPTASWGRAWKQLSLLGLAVLRYTWWVTHQRLCLDGGRSLVHPWSWYQACLGAEV